MPRTITGPIGLQLDAGLDDHADGPLLGRGEPVDLDRLARRRLGQHRPGAPGLPTPRRGRRASRCDRPWRCRSPGRHGAGVGCPAARAWRRCRPCVPTRAPCGRWRSRSSSRARSTSLRLVAHPPRPAAATAPGRIAPQAGHDRVQDEAVAGVERHRLGVARALDRPRAVRVAVGEGQPEQLAARRRGPGGPAPCPAGRASSSPRARRTATCRRRCLRPRPPTTRRGRSPRSGGCGPGAAARPGCVLPVTGARSGSAWRGSRCRRRRRRRDVGLGHGAERHHGGD